MKSWKKPTNELIDRAYGMMKKQFDHEYFFTRLKNPLWIQPLVERGCFQSPPKMKSCLEVIFKLQFGPNSDISRTWLGMPPMKCLKS